MANKNVKLKDGSDYLLPQTEGTNILSTSASSGQVLTADGSGSAAWQSIPESQLPLITPLSSQVVSVDPLIIELTSAQYAYFEDDNVSCIVVDGTNLGQTKGAIFRCDFNTKAWTNNNFNTAVGSKLLGIIYVLYDSSTHRITYGLMNAALQSDLAAKQDALPTTTTANKVLKSTSTAGTLVWGDAASGGVTSITAGTGLTGGTITTSGTIAIDSSVVALQSDLPTGEVNVEFNATYSGATTTLTNIKIGNTVYSVAADHISAEDVVI